MNNIPEGYTYQRCDIYTKEEFLENYKSKLMSEVCKEYVKNNPKSTYTTDDMIAVHQIAQARIVNPLPGGRKTTKRYKRNEE